MYTPSLIAIGSGMTGNREQLSKWKGYGCGAKPSGIQVQMERIEGDRTRGFEICSKDAAESTGNLLRRIEANEVSLTRSQRGGPFLLSQRDME